jgi:DNA-binding NarL/FixJ family response regulator
MMHSGKIVTRVLIADDHALVRRGLKELCREMGGFSAAGIAATGDEVLAALHRARFDLLLLDLSMPGFTCRELIGSIRAVNARMPILVFGVFDDLAVVRRVLQAGASGVVSHKSCLETLMLAMRKVASGGRFIDSLIGDELMRESKYTTAFPPDERLSPRELQVMTLLVQGLNVTKIASALSISDKTVSTHKVRLKRKLNLRNDAELVRCALDHGLVD